MAFRSPSEIHSGVQGLQGSEFRVRGLRFWGSGFFGFNVGFMIGDSEACQPSVGKYSVFLATWRLGDFVFGSVGVAIA